MLQGFISWDERPMACSMDICYTRDGRTLLVELNDAYSLGCYGLPGVLYAKLISARGSQLLGREDGFLQDFHRNQSVLMESIKKGDLSRVGRCCEKEISFINNNESESKCCIMDSNDFIEVLRNAIPETMDSVEVQHILSCSAKEYIGHDAIVVSFKNENRLVIWYDICEKGTIDKMHFLNPKECTLGMDHDLHLQAMVLHAICENNVHILHEYLDKRCMYRSEYADICLVGAKHIVDRFAKIRDNLTEDSQYTFEILRSEDELCKTNDLPDIYIKVLGVPQFIKGENWPIFYSLIITMSIKLLIFY